MAVFRAHADADGTMDFGQFTNLALYHGDVGYYRRKRARIGYGGQTDFYTASTSGKVFGEMVAAACMTLLAGRSASDYTFVEIGAETTGGILAGVSHPFAATLTCGVGEAPQIPKRAVVFSNELFDAQPFRRFVFKDSGWRELAVAIKGDQLVEMERATAPPPAFPSTAPEGYVIDAPLASVALVGQLVRQPWTGLFVACDYGKTWREIAEECPAGTARAYYRHQQSNDLLTRPGEQDLTCHICWDWLVEVLVENRFTKPMVESQEAFFIRNAEKFIAEASIADAGHFSTRKLSLLQLLHPSHLGQKFQVLHAFRE